MALEFFVQEIDFTLDKEDSVKDWILFIASSEGFQLAGINYIFCSDPYLLALNRTHLDHDYFTDILTFPYHEPGAIALAADIYISIDRVGENADSFHTGFDNELHRVMIHGLLHLMGYDDHDEAERQAMRQAEEKALAQRAFA